MHDRIIDALARHDAADAARETHDNWTTLEHLIAEAFDHDPHDPHDPHDQEA
jgi:hypothetical protein